MTAHLQAGTVLADKLRIVKLLGEGGMGSVYEVEHLRTKKRCALKLLHSQACRSGRMLTRFWREVAVDGRIANPHIIDVHDAGVLPGGEPYLVMELLTGETLAERIARQPPLAVEEICEIVRQVCEGVQAAHAARVIHRDLKPQNLFLTKREGRLFVKVLDFGISKIVDDGATLTTPGAALGTPAYMAPEQLFAEEVVDERADIYSLGVILYECATGRRPFSAGRMDLLALLVHEGKPTPVRAARPDLPERFCDVVARAMAVEKADRFASARELGEALREVRGDPRAIADETLVDSEPSPSIEGTDLLNSTVHIEPSESRAPLRSLVERSSIPAGAPGAPPGSRRAGAPVARPGSRSGVGPVAPPGARPGWAEMAKRRFATMATVGLAFVGALLLSRTGVFVAQEPGGRLAAPNNGIYSPPPPSLPVTAPPAHSAPATTQAPSAPPRTTEDPTLAPSSTTTGPKPPPSAPRQKPCTQRNPGDCPDPEPYDQRSSQGGEEP